MKQFLTIVTLPLHQNYRWWIGLPEKMKSWQKHHPLILLTLKISTIAVAAIMLTALCIWWSVLGGAFGKLPSLADLRQISQPVASEVYTADSVLIGQYYLQQRSEIAYQELSPALVNALVATEDARFFEHNGVDLRSWLRVFFKSVLLKDRSSGGGSTISQQLAKNLFPRQGEGTWALITNKLKEVAIARRLEQIYSKEQILELYLNTVPFSGNTYGVKVAAQHFFNTTPDRLNASQAAVLVGMLKATSIYNPVTNPELSKARRNLVLSQMEYYDYLSPALADSLQRMPLNLHYTPLNNNEGLATYFREHLRLELKEYLELLEKPNGMAYNLYTDGLKIYTTLDSRMQEYAEQAVAKHMAQLQQDFIDHLKGETPWENEDVFYLAKIHSDRYRSLESQGLDACAIDSIFEIPVEMTIFAWDGREKTVKKSPMDSLRYYLSFLNAGFLAGDPQTGRIYAWVGGIEHKYFKYDHVKSMRQVGSTFKPIVYTKAIQSGIHPCGYTANTLRRYSRYEGWMPKNADDKYGGLYSMEGALINSINTISVNMIMRAKPYQVAQLAEELGFAEEVPGVPSIALGAQESSLQNMLNVYGTFANRGKRPSWHYIDRIESEKGDLIADFAVQKDTCSWPIVIEQNDVDMINSMLRSAIDKGTGRRLRFRYHFKHDLAGKTGTSQNHSDGWFMAYNPQFVAGTWVGAESPSVRFRSLRLGQGANTALPIFANFWQQMDQDTAFAEITEQHFPKPEQEVLDKLACPNVKWPVADSLNTVPLDPAPVAANVIASTASEE